MGSGGDRPRRERWTRVLYFGLWKYLSCGVCTTPPSRHKNWGGRTLKDNPTTLLRTASIACPWPSQNQSIFSNFQNVEILCNIYMTIIQTKSKKHFPFSKNLPMRQNGLPDTMTEQLSLPVQDKPWTRSSQSAFQCWRGGWLTSPTP